MATPPSVSSARRMELGITVLRVIIGIVFFAHGWQKLFVFGHAGTTGAFTQMGIPVPPYTSMLVTAVEVVGGAFLVLGLFTRLVALLLAVEMLGAILLVHIKGGFFLPNGVEFALTLLAAAVALTIAGPGTFALDCVVAGRRNQLAGAPPV